MLQQLYDKCVKPSIRECRGQTHYGPSVAPNQLDETLRNINDHLGAIDAEQRIQNSEIQTLKCGNFQNVKISDTLKVDNIQSFSGACVSFTDPVEIDELTVNILHVDNLVADDTRMFAGLDCVQWKDIINESCVADSNMFAGKNCTEWKDIIATTLVNKAKDSDCFSGLTCNQWIDLIQDTCVHNAANATKFDNKTYEQVCEDILANVPPQPYSGEIDVYCGETCLCTINCENPLVLCPNAFNEYAKISTETYPGAYCTGTLVQSDIQDFITMNDVDACGYTTCTGTVTSVNACLNGCSASAITDCGTLALDITPSLCFDSITRNICTCLGNKTSNEITLPSGIFCTGTVSMAQSGENSNKPILLRNTQTVAVSSNCCPFTFNPRTGVLVAKCLCGKAQDSDCFGGCTYAEAKNDIRDGLVTNTELESCGYTTCVGTVTKVKVGTDEYTPSQGIVSLPAYPPNLSSCPGLNCTGNVTLSQLNAVSDRVTTIESYIPSQASSTNQLADKEFVNSSIETNTATFRGTFNSVADLEAYTGPKDNNDYAFVVTFNSATSSYQYDRYKYNGTEWVFEYTINTTGFTAEQLAALNSGITCTLVAKITDVYNCRISIQKNGTCIDSFTLNQSSNKSINITVPTKTSDITNDCSFTSCTGTVTGVTLNNCAFTGTGALSATIKPSLCYTTADRKLYTKLGNQTSSAVTLPSGINCTGTLVQSDIADMATCTWVTNQGYTTCTGTVTGVSLNGSSFTVNNGIASLTNFKPATAGTADNSTCFNGCTYAQACTNIRSGLCNHDCLVKLSLLCSNTDRRVLFSAQENGCICPVYASNGVSFTFNPSTGNLRIGDFSCDCCNRVYIKCDSGLVRSGSKGSQTNGFVVYKESNCLDNCSIGVGIGSGNVNRGFFDYCKSSETATSPTFRWLQYWDAEKEIHALPIWGELGANNKVVYSCVAPLPSNTKRYVLVCFDKVCTCNPSNSSAYFEIDIYSSKYNVWIDVSGTPSTAQMRTYWQTNGIDPNGNAYGSFCAALPDTTANNNCFWIAYGGYRAPVIKSSRKVYVICNTTTAPSGITFTAPTNRNSYTNVYCGSTCLCTLQGPANLCLGSLAFSSATIPTVNNSTIKIQKNSADVGSFTLNQALGATIDISVPTKTSDITNDSNFITMADVNACGYTTCKGTVTGVTLNGSSFTVGTNGIASLTNFKPATATLADCSLYIKRNAIKVNADYPLAFLEANTTIDNANIYVSCYCPLTYNSCTGVLKSTKFTYNNGGDTSRNIAGYQSKNYYGCRCTEMPICDFFKCLTACHNLASGENLTINYAWSNACNNIICWGTNSSISLSGGSVQVFANNYNKNLFDDNCGGWYNLVLKVNPVTGEEYSFRAYKGSDSASATTYVYNGLSVNQARNASNATNSTCFNGCTYANAKTDIRSGLCDHDCLVKLADVTTCNDRALLQTGAGYVAGCLCPVYKSACSPLMFNAVTGGLKVGSTICDGYVESGWYYTCGKSCSFSYPKSTTNYVLLGCFRNIFSRMNELELGFSLGGSGSAQNTGTLKILPGSASCFDLNNIELKMTSYAPGSRGITGIGFIADNTAYNCWICVVARVVNNSTGTNYSWPFALYRNRLSASVWTTDFQCLGPDAPTFTKFIAIPQNVNRNYYYNSALCSDFSNTNMTVKAITNSSSCPYILKCDVDACISDMATCTWVNSQGFTTCTGTLTGVSLNGSAFTVTNGVASLTNFKPATASLSDCADGVRRRFSDSSLPLLLAGGTAESCCGYTYIACTCPITYNGSNGLLTTRKLTLGLGENCTDAGMICAKGLCQTYPMICFINNNNDTNGNGYKISGGGIGIVGAGEGSNYVWCSLNGNSTNLYGAYAGKECLFLTSDSAIFFYTNTNTNNSACWKTSFIDTSGVYNGAVKGNVTGNLTGTASLVCRYTINTGVQQVLLGANCTASSGTCVRVSSKCPLTFDTDNGILTTNTFCGNLYGTASNSTCFGGCTYSQAYDDIRSGLVSSISLNGSDFTINNGAATLTGFKPATASLADCSTYVKRNVLANTTDAYYPLVLSNASTASNKASLYTPQASSVSYNAKSGTLKTYCFEAQYIRSDNLDVGFAGQSTSVYINSCYCALDNTIVVRDWTFCGLNGFMYGNVCGNICGDAQNAKAVSRNIAGANTTYDLLLTNGTSTADCTKVFVSSGGVNGTLKYDTGTQTLSVANISACCVCTPNLVTDNLTVNCGVNFTRPVCAPGACICTSACNQCLNTPIWPTIRTDSSIRGKCWEHVNTRNYHCCTCVWKIGGVFGIQPMILCSKAKQCDVFDAIQDAGIVDVSAGSYGILGNAWNYCVSDYCHHYIDNIYFGVDYISFRTVNTERFRVYAECTSCIDWNADFISFNRYEDMWFH